MAGKASGYGPFREALLGKPDVTLMPFCAICGRPAHDRHHVVQKGIGGASAEVDARIPLIRLCGSGNEDGCHGLLHAHVLHVYWDDGAHGAEPGWVFYLSPTPMDDAECWELNRAAYLPVPGWEEQRRTAEWRMYGAYGRSSTDMYDIYVADDVEALKAENAALRADVAAAAMEIERSRG